MLEANLPKVPGEETLAGRDILSDVLVHASLRDEEVLRDLIRRMNSTATDRDV